jgi:SPP1 gp7 family putative phage head morphogenesis protein
LAELVVPTPAPPGFSLGALKPEDAIHVFQQRKLLLPSFRWQDVWAEEHTRGFAVAGVLRLDVLREMRDAVDVAVANGQDLQDFIQGLRTKLQAKGFWGRMEITDPTTGEVRTTKFDDRRLKLIFDVNMRQSYMAGRWQRIQRGKMPYIVYRTMRDERVRVSHKAWDNTVLPKDHPWWDTHFPPCGWRCRCIAYATDERGLEQLRAAATPDNPVKTEPPPTQWVEFLNRSTGQTERVPRGIDPGFAYNPGKVHVQRGLEFMERTLASVQATHPAAADSTQVVRAVVARGRTERAFREFLDKPPVPGEGGPVGLPVAALPSMAGEPPIASVAAADLLAQARTADYPRALPTTAAGWAMAQAIIDQGQRLELASGAVLWWWARGTGDARRVHVLELQRSTLVWWVQRLAALSLDEALRDYPALARVL